MKIQSCFAGVMQSGHGVSGSSTSNPAIKVICLAQAKRSHLKSEARTRLSPLDMPCRRQFGQRILLTITTMRFIWSEHCKAVHLNFNTCSAGGDLGSAITCTLGSNYSEHCKAIHVNFVDVAHGHGIPQASNSKHIVSLENAPVPLHSMLPLDNTPEEAAWLAELEHFAKYETGGSQSCRCIVHDHFCKYGTGLL